MTALPPATGHPPHPPRVLHLNDVAFVGSTLVAALREAGIEAEILTSARPGGDAAQPLRALLLPMRLLALAGIALEARRWRPDVVHLHYARHGWVTPLLDSPYVLHCHGTDVRGTSPGQGWGRIVEPVMRGAAAVLYSTPDLEPWVASFRDDARFLPNPIPVAAAPAATPDRVQPQRDVLLGVRLDPIKGPGPIAELGAQVLRRRPSTTFTLIAHGSQLEPVRRALGTAATVIAPVQHAQMPRLFAAHRAAIGQFGVGILGNFELEAMAAGLPTAARFRFPQAYSEAPPVLDGDDFGELAARLVALLDDRNALAEQGTAARGWVAEHHAPSRIASQLVELYAALLAGAGRA